MHSSLFRLQKSENNDMSNSQEIRCCTHVTVEYSSSVKSWISVLRSDGMTYAGLCSDKRPMSPTAISRFSKTSSFNAMNSDRTFSACARCLSNLSWRELNTVLRIVASELRITVTYQYHPPCTHMESYEPGSAMPTVSNLSMTSLTISIEWLLAW